MVREVSFIPSNLENLFAVKRENSAKIRTQIMQRKPIVTVEEPDDNKQPNVSRLYGILGNIDNSEDKEVVSKMMRMREEQRSRKTPSRPGSSMSMGIETAPRNLFSPIQSPIPSTGTSLGK